MKTILAYQVGYPEGLRYRILKDVSRILDTGNLVLGEFTEKFENQWAAHIGKRFGVAVSSDSAALEIALSCVGVKDKFVVMPDMSFFGCVEAVYRAGGKPALVDIVIDRGVFPTKEMVLYKIAELRPENVGAVLAVFTAGYVSPDFIELVDACRKLGIPVIEDAAHCHGTMLQGKAVGSFGDLSCFSFFATKVLTTGGEGGMILTDDAEMAQRMRMYRNYGRGTTWGTGIAAIRGYNWRMTEFQAAVGCEILEDMKAFMVKREILAKNYNTFLEGSTVECISPPPKTTLGNYRYIVLLPDGVEKDRVKASLKQVGIGVQGDVYEHGITKQVIYPELKNAGYFPESERWGRRHLCLPIHLGMCSEDAAYVVEHLERIVREQLG